MGKGHYLKAAERACARKARYETPQEAERACDYRFRAYRCPVCGAYHLTSQSGAAKTSPPVPPAPEAPGPKLRDLDWNRALTPQPKPERPTKVRLRPTNPAPSEPPSLPARCVGLIGKDGRVLLALNGRLVKSARLADPSLKSRVGPNAWVLVRQGTQPPEILGVKETNE